jgi:hypothetical protein
VGARNSATDRDLQVRDAFRLGMIVWYLILSSLVGWIVPRPRSDGAQTGDAVPGSTAGPARGGGAPGPTWPSDARDVVQGVPLTTTRG